MLQRKVARKLSDSEMRSYKGPVHYISHHGIAKPDSKSTPLRIVFNSSANYKGHVLNEYWAKGPDVNNNLLAVLFRFRREQVALVGDIKKMYHSIDISMLDQHTHRFLWRNMEIDRPIHTYCVTAVNFGDGPSATMAIRALQRTAELSAELFPEAAQTLQENVYMDDIADNLQTVEKAYERSEEINAILSKGSFNVKEWTISGVNMDTTKFLGLEWNPRDDKLKVPVPTYCEEIGSLTKRKCLGAANSIYDPLGLLSPVTVRAKILLRNLWGKKVDWDQEIEPGDLDEWRSFLKDVKNCEKVSIPRSVKPSKQSENPTLIMFSDASKEAMGTVAYIRYETNLGVFESRLMAAKSRVAPVRITSIVRLELSAAVMSVRLAKTIREESRIPFVRVLYLVDSEIVRSMIQKESYGFKTFAATRIGEIQQFSDSTDWFWVAGKDNIADIISRSITSKCLEENKQWFQGPEFMRNPLEQWPISQSCSVSDIPERVGVIMVADVEEVIESPINIKRFGSFDKLLKTTAMVKRIAKQKSFKSAGIDLNENDIYEAERYWIKTVQRPIRDLKIKTPVAFTNKYGSLGPMIDEDGIVVVGERIKNHVHFSYNNKLVPLLPTDHTFSKLYTEKVHKLSHSGVSATMAKVRAKYWIIRLRRIVSSVRNKCMGCRRLEGKVQEQIMGSLPIQRLKPSPPWTYVGCDLFGPFRVRGEVQKRTHGKAYGVILNCLVTRAVHLDLAVDYSEGAVQKVFRRFSAIRGYPAEVFTDCGSQLAAMHETLKKSSLE
ncbi:uncharacterized protein [Antedon mediterranea]|uniref:uncharacterized protein n=1 Tax=Antedon mediterranea TaxID=105859 RepID=UPI003AF8AB8F